MSYLLDIPNFSDDDIKNKLIIVNKYINEITTSSILNNRKIDTCPYCNGDHFIKHGNYRGLQRFKCKSKNCNKTFSSKTNTIFSYSKKSVDLWMKYFILMNNGKSLRECSKILNINLATSFFLRHKILTTENRNNNGILKNYVEISKLIFKENLKGNKSAKYIKKENIFISCGIDINSTIISKVISRRTISLSTINEHFAKNIDKTAVLSTYNDRYFDIYAKKQNASTLPLSKEIILNLVSQIQTNKHSNRNSIEINNINERLPSKSIFIHKFSLNIRNWLFRFKGVATKYLENYLNWYIIDFKNNYETFLLNQVLLFKDYFSKSSYIKISEFSDYKLSFQRSS